MAAGPRFAVFVSGTGRTLRYLAEDVDSGALPGEVGLVVASRECPAADFGRQRSVRTEIHKGFPDAGELEGLLRDAGCAWAVLGGYTRLLPVPRSLTGRMVNIHPALLPSFGGPGMYGERVHRAVLEAGCRVSGCTVHLCDATYDTGPIVAQACCEVLDDDTPETLASRVFDLERRTYPRALRDLFCGRVSIEGRRTRIIRE